LGTNNNTVFTGKVLFELDKTESTNTWLKDLERAENLANGTVVVANHQIAGRGQGKNQWKAEAGKSLTFSVLYKPKAISPSNLFTFNMAVSLAVYDVIDEILPNHDVKVKWPNDVFVVGKKISGILIETILRNNSIDQCITGIGINVNQLLFEGIPDATSIAQHLGETVPLPEVLNSVLISLEQAYLLVESGRNSAGILNRYNSLLFKLNEPQKFASNGREFTALVKGVNKNGQLMLEVNGIKKLFSVGELSWVK